MLKVPYALTPAVALDQRYDHMRAAIQRALPRLDRSRNAKGCLQIAAYGPSLIDTWTELDGAKGPIMSMSGTTKFLVERGITPDYHIDMDPRANKVMTSLPAVPGVKYLVASVCCPEYFSALESAGVEIVIWHAVSSNWEQDLQWVAKEDPGALVISTGSTIGLAALQVGGLLGFTRFEIHGMDGSHRDGRRHAGPHSGKTQRDDITWAAGGKVYRTSKIMANAVAETVNTARNFPIITTWYGDGLTQALIREADLPNACCADQPDKRAWLASNEPLVAQIPTLPKGKVAPWGGFLKHLTQDDLPELIEHISICEPRRDLARYRTGSIPWETAVRLRAMSRFYLPQVVCEIGTFIGRSTLALKAGRVLYTCDKDNDCVPLTEAIITHPYRTSTEMLGEIQEPVDFFFFDGRIQEEDLPEIARLSHRGTVYAFDDYVSREKGVVNVERLQAIVSSTYLLIPPEIDRSDRTTLAALVPMGSPL